MIFCDKHLSRNDWSAYTCSSSRPSSSWTWELIISVAVITCTTLSWLRGKGWIWPTANWTTRTRLELTVFVTIMTSWTSIASCGACLRVITTLTWLWHRRVTRVGCFSCTICTSRALNTTYCNIRSVIHLISFESWVETGWTWNHIFFGTRWAVVTYSIPIVKKRSLTEMFTYLVHKLSTCFCLSSRIHYCRISRRRLKPTKVALKAQKLPK